MDSNAIVAMIPVEHRQSSPQAVAMRLLKLSISGDSYISALNSVQFAFDNRSSIMCVHPTILCERLAFARWPLYLSHPAGSE